MIKQQILPLSEDFKRIVGIKEDVEFFIANNVEFESDKKPNFGKVSSLKWTYKIIESSKQVELSLIVPDQKVTVIDSDDEEFQVQISNVHVEIKKTTRLQFSPDLVEVWAGKVKVEF